MKDTSGPKGDLLAELDALRRQLAERERATETLRQREVFYQSVLDNLPHGVALTDLDGCVLLTNDKMARLHGFDSATDLLDGNRVGFEIVPQQYRTQLIHEHSLHPTARGEAPNRSEFVRNDLGWPPIHVRTIVVVDELACPLGFIAMARTGPIETDSHQALIALERRYQTLMETSPDAIVLADLEGNVVMANLKAAQAYGFNSEEELITCGKSVFDFIAPEDRLRSVENAAKTLESGGIRNIEYTLVRRDGSKHDAEISASLVLDNDGNPQGFLGVVRDITERRQAEKALVESEQRYRSLVETSPDAVGFADLSGRIITANQRAMELLGVKNLDEMTREGASGFDFIAPQCHEQVKEDLSQLAEIGQLRNSETTLARADGSTFPAETSATLVRAENGEPIGFTVITRDITERKKAEREMAQRYQELARINQELEQLHRNKDEFIATVSHELRSPLVTGLGYLEMALAGHFGQIPEEAQNRLKTSLKSLKRLSVLIDDIVEYHSLVRQDSSHEPIPVVFDLRDLIDECVDSLLLRAGREPDAVTVEVPDNLPNVFADEDMIRRVLSDLLNNAVQHAGPDANIRIQVAPTPDDRLDVTVEDDGIGIPPGILERLFEPFFKHESNRQGSGLGLCIVKNILEAHGCTLQLESEKFKGTRVRFDLPCARNHS